MVPLPPINKVFSLVVQQESQRSIHFNVFDQVKPTALATEYVSIINASRGNKIQYARNETNIQSLW